MTPDIDETKHDEESAQNLVKRLAKEKALAISKRLTNVEDTIIISSDQVATLENIILGKPGNFENALEQLTLFSGKTICFLTSLCLLNNKTKEFDISVAHYSVTFRELSHTEICHYINVEQPFDCAGSFKCEGLGVALFEKMSGDDPNSLVGLPLINLCYSLTRMGVNPLLSK